MLQCRHQVDVAVQKNQQWVAETRTLVPLDVREQADSGFLPISGMREIATIWSRMREDSVEAIMLAAPLGEQRMVGMAESDMTRESSSWGISWPITCSICGSMPSALAHLLRIRLRIADEGVDVVALKREERGLQGNSTDIAVVHLEWS